MALVCEAAVSSVSIPDFSSLCFLVESSLETHNPDGLYIAGTLVWVRLEVAVRVLNAALRDQTLTKGSHRGHFEPVTLMQ
jgi:hypothetical protein